MTQPQPGACRECVEGRDCLFADALAVNIVDSLDRYECGETNARGLGILLRSEISEWHDCPQGRHDLDAILDGAVAEGTSAYGLGLLLRRHFGATLRPRPR